MTFSGPLNPDHAVMGLHVEVMGDEAVEISRAVSLTHFCPYTVSCQLL